MARTVPFIVTSFFLLCVLWIFFLDWEDFDSLSDAFVFMHSWWSRRESSCWKWLACVLVEVMPFEVDTIENSQHHPSQPWFFHLTKRTKDGSPSNMQFLRKVYDRTWGPTTRSCAETLKCDVSRLNNHALRSLSRSKRCSRTLGAWPGANAWKYSRLRESESLSPSIYQAFCLSVSQTRTAMVLPFCTEMGALTSGFL